MEKKKNYLIGGLLIAIIAMAVGYAALAQQLNINGTANITSKWDIHFDGFTESFENGAANAKDGEGVEIKPTATGTAATFNVDLAKPGSKATYTFTVKNAGSIDATLDAISDLNTINAQEPTQIVFTVSGVEVGDSLPANGTATVTVTAEWLASSDAAPEESVSKTVTISLDYVQA